MINLDLLPTRDIKHRAWDNINHKWLLGYELPRLGGFSMWGECMLFGEYERILNSFALDKFDKLILTQSTGCLDINKKLIYEGDIVRYSTTKVTDKISYIEYRDHGFWVKDEKFGWEGEHLADWSEIEIIGNIFEHSELLTTTL